MYWHIGIVSNQKHDLTGEPASSKAETCATSALNFERSWQSNAMVINVHTITMDHYIILNWVENSGSYTKSHGVPPRPLWVCLQEQWPVDCTQVCMPLLPLLLNTSFFAAGCMLSKKVNGSTCAWDCSSRALCEVRLSSQATKVQRILFNKVLMNELLTNTQTTHNNRWSSLTLLCTGNLNSIAKGSRSFE